tara:strand:- start:7856 stop:8281 length:426 start_codon:yes stop_codon:yes gene_type:complete
MKKLLINLTIVLLISSCSKLNFFGFGEKKNKFEELKINEFLWIASNDMLESYPNKQNNLKEGYISTDWIILEEKPNIKFKILIYILGSDLIEENVEILFDRQSLKNGVWIEEEVSELFKKRLQKNIISNAKKLKLKKDGKI